MISLKVELPAPSFSVFNRLDSRDYYKAYPCCRCDIFVVQFSRIANCFFYTDDRCRINLWEDIYADADGLKQIEIEARKVWDQYKLDNPNYVPSHQQFFNSLEVI